MPFANGVGLSTLACAALTDESRKMTTITVVDRPEQLTAGVRERVPMSELTQFFSRAFEHTMKALEAQGVHPNGAPFGKYYGQPGETVDVEAGFPVASVIASVGDVKPGMLPGGRIVEAVHVGPFDTMERTYAELQHYFTDTHLDVGDVMWENYLTDPEVEPDATKWRTQICWPVR